MVVGWWLVVVGCCWLLTGGSRAYPTSVTAATHEHQGDAGAYTPPPREHQALRLPHKSQRHSRATHEHARGYFPQGKKSGDVSFLLSGKKGLGSRVRCFMTWHTSRF